MNFILLHFEPHTMQIQLTSRLAAPHLCLWWPNWPKSHLSASFCFTSSYCFLILLPLICYYPFYCFVPGSTYCTHPSRVGSLFILQMVWPMLKVFSLSSLTLGKLKAVPLLMFVCEMFCIVFICWLLSNII